MNEPIRLSRRVAMLQGCSRSEAEQLIEGGWVRVDGRVVEEPQARVLDQVIAVDPKAKPTPALPVTFLLNKLPGGPARISPEQRADDDASGVRLLQRHLHHLAGPMALPDAASGLAVLTQDGRVLRHLSDDGVEEEWIVQVAGTVAPELVQRLSRDLRGKASVNSQSETEARLRVAAKGLPPGRLPALCEAAGLRILSLKRLRLGRLSVGQLAPGRWRYLMPNERF
ncbi:MAG: RNA-binding protein [Ramlibacter sp.]|jgi:23S rRNA pseudouridine2604 synthase|nr:RNA-binding protein [Ramlibacter sp.]